MSKFNMFLISSLLVLVRSHVNHVCTHSSVEHPAQLNFLFFTYHEAAPAGGSVPGTTTIEAPSGTRTTFQFTSYATLEDAPVDYALTVDELREATRNAAIVSDGSEESMESRYGDFSDFVCYGGDAYVGVVLGGAEQPNQRLTHSLSYGSSNLQTVYIASVNEASSGTYSFWTDGTDFNLDSDCLGVGEAGTVGACIAGEQSASQITVNVVSAGSPCSSSSFPSSPDFSAPSSLQDLSLPGTIIQPTCVAEMPFRTGVVTCSADGTWVSTVQCSSEPGCQNSAYDPNAVSVIGVEAITSEHPSCDDFAVSQGSVCHVVCEDGQYAPGKYQVACVGHDQWQVVNSGTCLDNTQSNPPNPPVITSVHYDYDRLIVTVTFDFNNGDDDDLVHSWRIEASNQDLGPQNQLNTVVNPGFLELSIPSNGVQYELFTICYTVSVENSVGAASSELFCVQETPDLPTPSPTTQPTEKPSTSPTPVPPSNSPTLEPTVNPSTNPTYVPSNNPTLHPTVMPSTNPTQTPSNSPTFEPTVSPSTNPSQVPSNNPTLEPTVNPSTNPTQVPSDSPTLKPTVNPSTKPSVFPSTSPTQSPSKNPSVNPSTSPSTAPTTLPSRPPSTIPTATPSSFPSRNPSFSPSDAPAVTQVFLAEDEVTDGILILVFIVSAATCCCCVCLCVLLRRKEEDEEKKDPEVTIMVDGVQLSSKRTPTESYGGEVLQKC